jgi:hypothetical protein
MNFNLNDPTWSLVELVECEETTSVESNGLDSAKHEVSEVLTYGHAHTHFQRLWRCLWSRHWRRPAASLGQCMLRERYAERRRSWHTTKSKRACIVPSCIEFMLKSWNESLIRQIAVLGGLKV